MIDDTRFEVVEPNAPSWRQYYMAVCPACGEDTDPRDLVEGFRMGQFCDDCWLDAHASVRSYGPLTESQYHWRLAETLARRTSSRKGA